MSRLHALDSLRASMMLLGIWLHTVVGYSTDGNWPYKDPHPTAVYNWTLAVIHIFRMPVFFLMAGFFGALLWERGRDRFVRNRVSRIAVPFVVFWTALAVPVLWLATYSRLSAEPHAAARATRFLFSGAIAQQLHPMHLWFLEYLIVLYAIAYVAVRAFEAFAPASVNRMYRALVGNPLRSVIFAIPSAAVLMTMQHGWIEDPPGFMPVPRIVAIYAIMFFFGWALYANRDLLEPIRAHAWRELALAGVLFAGWIVLVTPIERRPEIAGWILYPRACVVALLMWLFAFGLIGLFLRYLSGESRLMRYLSDGSYWMYIVHLLVVIAFQMGLAGVAMNAAWKVPIVVALSTLVLVVSYDVLVRNTAIGVLLNGRRYPRWLTSGTSRTSPGSAS